MINLLDYRLQKEQLNWDFAGCQSFLWNSFFISSVAFVATFFRKNFLFLLAKLIEKAYVPRKRKKENNFRYSCFNLNNSSRTSGEEMIAWQSYKIHNVSWKVYVPQSLRRPFRLRILARCDKSDISSLHWTSRNAAKPEERAETFFGCFWSLIVFVRAPSFFLEKVGYYVHSSKFGEKSIYIFVIDRPFGS